MNEINSFYKLAYECPNARQDENGYIGYCSVSKSGACNISDDNCPIYRPITLSELKEHNKDGYETIINNLMKVDVFKLTEGFCDLSVARDKEVK